MSGFTFNLQFASLKRYYNSFFCYLLLLKLCRKLNLINSKILLLIFISCKHKINIWPFLAKIIHTSSSRNRRTVRICTKVKEYATYFVHVLGTVWHTGAIVEDIPTSSTLRSEHTRTSSQALLSAALNTPTNLLLLTTSVTTLMGANCNIISQTHTHI